MGIKAVRRKKKKKSLLVVCSIIYSVYNGKCWEIIIITFVNSDIIIVTICY